MAPTLSRRQLLGLGGGAAATLALSGCGGGSSAGGSGGDASSTDLTWQMWSASTAEVDAWKKVADIAGRASGSTIAFQTAAWNDYWTKLTSQAASGQTADIVSVQSLRAPQFAQLFTDLSPKLADMGVSESDFDSSILDALKVDGKLLALPYDFGPLVVFYNKTAFEQAGLALPAMGWTQDDFLAAARKLTSGNTYGFFAGAVPDSIIPFAMSQHGVQAVTSDGELDIDNDEWRDTLNWYRSLVVTEKVASPLPAAGSQAAATNQFLAGNAAMNIDGPWSLINAKATASFEVGIAPMPVGGSGSKTVTAGSGFGVSTAAANQDLAAKATAGLVNVESETYLGQSGRAFPARTAQQSAWYEGNQLQDAQEVMDAMIAAAEGYRTTAKWTQVNNEWNKYAVPCFNGDSDVDSFIQQVMAQA